MINLQTWQYDPDKGCDKVTTFGTLNIDPATFADPQDAANKLFEALDSFATANGYSEGSVSLWEPDEAAKRGYGNNWMVSWEDGPYQWGIFASSQMHGKWGYTEPYYSFDLCFVN